VILLIFFLGFVIGERANFIRLIGITFLFLFFLFLLKKKIRIFFIIFLSLFLLIISLITYDRINNNEKKLDSYNDRYYIRYVKEFDRILDSSLLDYLKKDTRHGLHYYTAINIFKDFKFTGVGLKNFRIFSKDSRYDPEFSNQNGYSTHPHQVYFEILSEMGLLGLIFFFITFFIILKESYQRSYNDKNLIGLSAASFVLVTFLPLIPSGSFFTSYSATLFWMNFGLMYNLRNKLT
jgi:O-antigen ligase